MQVLGLCESYWRIYSLALMVVGEIICEQFLRLCGAEGLSTALVLLHLPWHTSSIGKKICAQVLGLSESFWRIYSFDSGRNHHSIVPGALLELLRYK